MTDAEEFLLSLYKDVKELSCTNISQVVLVRHQLDNQLYIRRTLPKDRRSLYFALKQHSFPGIPAIKEIIYDGKTIVLEQYIEGCSLSELAHKGLSTADFTSYMISLLQILHNLHSNGIIHRDLKEENILIDTNSQLFLIDFAISKTITSDANSEENTLGTIAYAAPEQFGLAPTDPKSDLFSFGKICLNLLQCCSTLSSVQREMWTTIADKCLAFHPQNRYASAEEILQIIKQPALFHGSSTEHLISFVHSEYPPSVQINGHEEKTVTHFFHADTITFSEQNGKIFLSITAKDFFDKVTIFDKTPVFTKDNQSLTEFFFLKDSILAARIIYHLVLLPSGKYQKITEYYQARQIFFSSEFSMILSMLYENLSGYSILGTEEFLLDNELMSTYPLTHPASDF